MTEQARRGSGSDWLTLGQAATYLGVAQSTIRKWSDGGRLPAFYTPGGHRRFRRGDLDTFLGSSRPAARTPRPGRRRRRRPARARPREPRGRRLRRPRGGERRGRARRARRGAARPHPPRRRDAAGGRLGDAAPRARAARRGVDPGRHVQRQGGGGLGCRRPRSAARRRSSASRSTPSSCSPRPGSSCAPD